MLKNKAVSRGILSHIDPVVQDADACVVRDHDSPIFTSDFRVGGVQKEDVGRFIFVL